MAFSDNLQFLRTHRGQLLLGLAPVGAEKLQVVGKCHFYMYLLGFGMVSAYPNTARNSTDFVLRLKIFLSTFSCAGV